LVKPVGTQDLLRQIEALLVQQQDEKQSIERAQALSAENQPEEIKAKRKAS